MAQAKEPAIPVNDPAAAVERRPPPLPEAPTASSSKLSEKMVTIYGAPGVGKTTLASQWGGGGGFFFNCAGELGEFTLLQQSITSWTDFREYSWAIADRVAKGDGYAPCSIIDTADALGRYCALFVRESLGIVHESDLDYGKGWQALRDNFSVNVSKLAALPNHGVIFVAHADEKEVKTKSQTYDKWQIRGVKSIRETMLDMSDLVLFVDFSEDDDTRVIKTKPSRNWDAKERGSVARLPAEIKWPVGENAWDIINAVWQENGGQ